MLVKYKEKKLIHFDITYNGFKWKNCGIKILEKTVFLLVLTNKDVSMGDWLNWCRKTQPNVGNTAPRQMILDCIRRLARGLGI